MGIGVFSPLFEMCGNSVRGVKVCADLSQQFGQRVFDLGTRDAQFQRAAAGRLVV